MSGTAKEREYYILSLKWTRGDEATWWNPDNAGYTIVLDRAGRYAESRVKAAPCYYNNGVSTRAIPCEEAEKIATRVVVTDSKFWELAKQDFVPKEIA